jgi:hypothetical protein
VTSQDHTVEEESVNAEGTGAGNEDGRESSRENVVVMRMPLRTMPRRRTKNNPLLLPCYLPFLVVVGGKTIESPASSIHIQRVRRLLSPTNSYRFCSSLYITTRHWRLRTRILFFASNKNVGSGKVSWITSHVLYEE